MRFTLIATLCLASFLSQPGQSVAGSFRSSVTPWPDGKIHYVLEGFSDSEEAQELKRIFREACARWQAATGVVTCIELSALADGPPGAPVLRATANKAHYKTLVDRKYHSWHSYVVKGAGLNGAIAPTRVFFLDPDIWLLPGRVLHETGHIVGLSHEHQRADRGDFIEMFWRRIKNGRNNSQMKLDETILGADNDAGPYDYCSIMHYSEIANRRGRRPTIRVRRAQDYCRETGRCSFEGCEKIGQYHGLTDLDCRAAQRLYGEPETACRS